MRKVFISARRDDEKFMRGTCNVPGQKSLKSIRRYTWTRDWWFRTQSRSGGIALATDGSWGRLSP